MKIITLLLIFFLSFTVHSFPLPKENKATYDVIRKNKVIGSIETTFNNQDSILEITTVVDIEVKVLFVTAYKFYQNSKETWIDNEFIEIEGYTDFEDEREYFIRGKDIDNIFLASGMDGALQLDKSILPLNYWNKDILKQKKIFDTQKGIVREIQVTKLKDEEIEINDKKILAEKYLFNATKHPKDKGPFPEYTLWYAKNEELLKFRFINWKDKKEVITIRNNWDQ
tara:strand:+ start:231 stop:908 length:678 start_codon:yes stop_codon:yes gene_type:complete